MKKNTIKITDLSSQKAQIDSMAGKIDEAMKLLVDSISSMTTAGMESFSPIVIIKMRELLSTLKVQHENLVAASQIIQVSMDTMTSVDANIRDHFKDANSGPIYNPSMPVSDQKPIYDYVSGNQSYVPSHTLKANIEAKGYNGVMITDGNGNINLDAFRQGRDEYQWYPEYVKDKSGNNMKGLGCNLCSNAFVLTDMGVVCDPIDYYDKTDGYCNPILSQQLINGRCDNSPNADSVVQYLNEHYSVESEGNYSKPVICCAASGSPTGEHYMAVLDFVRDENNNVITGDYWVMDPACGAMKKLSECRAEYGLGAITSVRRYVKG